MDEVRYMISEASKQVEVESHVLRYWEEELELPIGRNEMHHRYYKESDIKLLKTIKNLKEHGFTLKAIKLLLPNIQEIETLDNQTMVRLKDELNGKENVMWDEEQREENLENNEGTSIVTNQKEEELSDVSNDKMSQFKSIMSQIILSALKENNSELASEICANVTEGVIKEMSYLMRIQEEKEEERFRKFDATLREYQKSRVQAALALEGKSRQKSKFFKKNKVHI